MDHKSLATLVEHAITARPKDLDWKPDIEPGEHDTLVGVLPAQLRCLARLVCQLQESHLMAQTALEEAIAREAVVQRLLATALMEVYPTKVTPELVHALKICKGWKVYGTPPQSRASESIAAALDNALAAFQESHRNRSR